jgi:hypothetical protein
VSVCELDERRRRERRDEDACSLDPEKRPEGLSSSKIIADESKQAAARGHG